MNPAPKWLVNAAREQKEILGPYYIGKPWYWAIHTANRATQLGYLHPYAELTSC